MRGSLTAFVDLSAARRLQLNPETSLAIVFAIIGGLLGYFTFGVATALAGMVVGFFVGAYTGSSNNGG